MTWNEAMVAVASGKLVTRTSWNDVHRKLGVYDVSDPNAPNGQILGTPFTISGIDGKPLFVTIDDINAADWVLAS